MDREAFGVPQEAPAPDADKQRYVRLLKREGREENAKNEKH